MDSLGQATFLISCLLILSGCVGHKHSEYNNTEPYVQEDHCISPGNCLRDAEVTTPPGYVNNPSSPGMTPPVSQPYNTIPQASLAPQAMPSYPQEYRYSVIQNGQYSWGRVTVDQDGHYRGWDINNGFSWGTIRPEGYYQPPSQPQQMPVYPQEYRYSGVKNGEYHWGRMTVDPDGHYSGYDSQGGIIFGNIEAQ